MTITKTKLGIANSSLLRLGHPRIASFTEGSLAAEVINGMYEIIKGNALSQHNWRFALRETTLAQATDRGYGGTEYTYAYDLPPKSLRLLGLDNNTSFEIFGSQIYTNAESVIAIYIEDVDESMFPAYFVEALSLQISADVSMAIDEDMPKSRLQHELASRQWVRSRHKDSMTSPTVSLSGAIGRMLSRESQRL